MRGAGAQVSAYNRRKAVELGIRVSLLALVLVCSGLGEARSEERPEPLPVAQVSLHTFNGSGSATQGVALAPEHYFASDNIGATGIIYRFDRQWTLIDSKEITLPGVDHLGALSYHDGHLWTGFLNSKGPRKSLVVKIDVATLSVAATYDITADVTWIDPVCFDGRRVWVGDMSDLGIHAYRIQGDSLVREGILRYPKELHFSQGIQVRGTRLYSMHTFGDWDGLAEFDIAGFAGELTVSPRRVWDVPETLIHHEGFDFVPDRPGVIWHAQGKAVEALSLSGFHE